MIFLVRTGKRSAFIFKIKFRSFCYKLELMRVSRLFDMFLFRLKYFFDDCVFW